MKKVEKKICPLLSDRLSYSPDTIDLLNNEEAINYWLPCLEEMVRKFIDKVAYLRPEDATARDRAQQCFEEFHNLVHDIKYTSGVFKPLSVRTLLEFNENVLRKHNFDDPWLLQKEKETAGAFLQYEDRIKYIDSIGDFGAKWIELAKGLIAGNMFDWGAKAVTDILEQSNGFGLSEALLRIQERPWFQDDLDQWIDRLQKKSYKKVVMFIDNAGIDFVLGILPFTRQLLMLNIQVVLSANSAPALNDVTYQDLKVYLTIARQQCSIIEDAILRNRLLYYENGQNSPCLDLLNLPSELCEAMKDADLIILEGMGRAVHTNLKAQFKVDCLKLAVLKNEWLAKNLGTQQFSVIFEYEPALS